MAGRRVQEWTLIIAAAVLAAGASNSPSAVMAQDRTTALVRIAAVVNDEVISAYDVEHRVRLVLLSTKAPVDKTSQRQLVRQVLRGMIDETLRLQEAKKLNIKISERRIDQGIAVLEKRNKMPKGQLVNILTRNRIEPTALRNKIRADMAWRELVRRRMISKINVGEEEVEEELNRLKSLRHLPRNRVAEIFLSVDSPENDRRVREVSVRLIQQIQAGTQFAALAREFSESASAAVGGDLGWVVKGQLDEELEEAIAGLEPGGVAGPVRTLNGYHVLALLGRKVPNGSDQAVDQANLSQLLLPIGANADTEFEAQTLAEATRLRTQTRSCKELETLAQTREAPQSGNLGTIKLAALPGPLRDAVTDLPEGAVTSPIRVAEGYLLMMVCERAKSDQADLPNRKELRNRIGDRRLNLLMQRYMRDLRRTAFVDIRQ